MSRMYDDLKRRRGSGADDPEPMDLFAHAEARRAEAEKPAPVSEEAPLPDLAPPPDVSTSPAPSAPDASVAEFFFTPSEERPADPDPSAAPMPDLEPMALPPKVTESEDLHAAPPGGGYPMRGYGHSAKPLTGVLDPLNDIRVPQLFGRRRSRILVAALAFGAVILVIGAILFANRGRFGAAGRDAAVEEGSDAELEEALARSRAIRMPPPVVAPSAGSMRVPPSDASAGLPVFKDVDLNVSDAAVTTEGGVRIVKFRSGVFAGGTRISRAANEALMDLGRRLVPYRDSLAVTVVGCTDNEPVNRGSRYEDNEELGLQRAEAAVKVLRGASGIPAEQFRMLSYGERWSPYPNDTPRTKPEIERLS